MHMSLLQQVQRGKAHLPPRILVYGTEGVGKSSLAARLRFRIIGTKW
jgi:polynucleotide 5'-kinase involved in rRNA processing